MCAYREPRRPIVVYEDEDFPHPRRSLLERNAPPRDYRDPYAERDPPTRRDYRPVDPYNRDEDYDYLPRQREPSSSRRRYSPEPRADYPASRVYHTPESLGLAPQDLEPRAVKPRGLLDPPRGPNVRDLEYRGLEPRRQDAKDFGYREEAKRDLEYRGFDRRDGNYRDLEPVHPLDAEPRHVGLRSLAPRDTQHRDADGRYPDHIGVDYRDLDTRGPGGRGASTRGRAPAPRDHDGRGFGYRDAEPGGIHLRHDDYRGVKPRVTREPVDAQQRDTKQRLGGISDHKQRNQKPASLLDLDLHEKNTTLKPQGQERIYHKESSLKVTGEDWRDAKQRILEATGLSQANAGYNQERRLTSKIEKRKFSPERGRYSPERGNLRQEIPSLMAEFDAPLAKKRAFEVLDYGHAQSELISQVGRRDERLLASRPDNTAYMYTNKKDVITQQKRTPASSAATQQYQNVKPATRVTQSVLAPERALYSGTTKMEQTNLKHQLSSGQNDKSIASAPWNRITTSSAQGVSQSYLSAAAHATHQPSLLPTPVSAPPSLLQVPAVPFQAFTQVLPAPVPALLPTLASAPAPVPLLPPQKLTSLLPTPGQQSQSVMSSYNAPSIHVVRPMFTHVPTPVPAPVPPPTSIHMTPVARPSFKSASVAPPVEVPSVIPPVCVPPVLTSSAADTGAAPFVISYPTAYSRHPTAKASVYGFSQTTSTIAAASKDKDLSATQKSWIQKQTSKAASTKGNKQQVARDDKNKPPSLLNMKLKPYVPKRLREAEAETKHGKNVQSSEGVNFQNAQPAGHAANKLDAIQKPVEGNLTDEAFDNSKINPMYKQPLIIKREYAKESSRKFQFPSVKRYTMPKHSGPVTHLRWCTPMYSHLLMSVSMDNTLKIWDCFKDTPTSKLVNFHEGAIKDAVWSHDGCQVVSCGFDKTARLVDIPTGKELRIYDHPTFVTCVKFHPEKPQEFITGTDNSGVACWDTRTHSVVRKYEGPTVGQILDVQFLPGGTEFLTSCDVVSRDSANRTIMAWDYGTSAVVSNQIYQELYTCPTLKLHPGMTEFVAQSNGDYIVKFQATRPYAMNKRIRFEGHEVKGYPVGCNFSPDGTYLLSGSADGKMYIYNYMFKEFVNKRSLVKTIECYDSACIDVVPHPFLSGICASCSWGGDITLWK